ncbi:hypothetical protein [Facklamia sp. 7083-14-GEN3]|uniref:hypothetical protein n=1 Tax=Facklamia sp. 7083-14-GEN3 TaxID=2973478 RepID=UPI00215CA284|nr:hypothetical protein [Facklamia sp. 7083-14-GEN3]MCR8968754.1 hypothetical protein [Facklamia sp. 7083-14-GEN3]
MNNYDFNPHLKSLFHVTVGYLLGLCVIYFFKGELGEGSIFPYLGVILGTQYSVWRQEKKKYEKKDER